MEAAERQYRAIAEKLPGAVSGQLFGKPCFKVNGKAFIAFFHACMVFKLTGDAHREALELPGAVLFDPSGKARPMKEWVQVPYEHHAGWPALAEAACAYVKGAT